MISRALESPQAPDPAVSRRAILLPLVLSALLVSACARAAALRLVPGSLSATPSEVLVSQDIVVRASFEAETERGTEKVGVEISAEPSNLVALKPAYQSLVMDEWSCSNTGRMDYAWAFKSLAPGEVVFRINAALTPCRDLVKTASANSAPVKIKPIPIWNEIRVSPGIVDTNGVVEIAVDLRNDSPIPAEYLLPEVHSDVSLGRSSLMVQEGKPEYNPPKAFSRGRMHIEPAERVSAKWRFRAGAVGEHIFMVSAAGMFLNSPPFKVRDPARLVVEMPPAAGPSAVGREYVLRGALYVEGGTGVLSPQIRFSWTPEGSVRPVSGPVSPPERLDPGAGKWEFARTFECAVPGTVLFTISAQGGEADTGDPVGSEGGLTLRILPPPDLDLSLRLESATVFEEQKAGFALDIKNRGVGVSNLSPVYEIRSGRGLFGPSSPLFQSVASESAVSFSGSVVPVDPGILEFAARVEARGQVEGTRVSVASEPVRMTVLPYPEFLIFALSDRVRADNTSEIRFLLKNPMGTSVAVDSMTANLSIPSTGGGGRTNVRGARMILGPAKSATLTLETYLGGSADPYPVTASVNISGKSVPFGLPFSVNMPSRLLSLACPWQTRFVVVEPPQVFLPPLDPLLYAEFSLTGSGEAVLAVIDSNDAVVRVISGPVGMNAGWHSALWRGDSAGGRGQVKPGNYVLRLAGFGPAGGEKAALSQGARWNPSAFLWQTDYPIEVRRP